MKRIANMTEREREALVHELEVEHRVAVVDAARIKRELRELQTALAAKEQRAAEIESGIAALRGL
ncbi:hypothetical protein First_0032 [Mycobacterium phage First]|uniref:hypothetical protein n=1 Tax=Mycobacterium phage First TaxID=1245814 RepID=UPI0002C141E0|nr:hypothetical protein First_0032 [Mycobacterium phage First]AFV51158.1 hypothetical protein First_0032 [Mycobacterium phage First]